MKKQRESMVMNVSAEEMPAQLRKAAKSVSVTFWRNFVITRGGQKSPRFFLGKAWSRQNQDLSLDSVWTKFIFTYRNVQIVSRFYSSSEKLTTACAYSMCLQHVTKWKISRYLNSQRSWIYWEKKNFNLTMTRIQIVFIYQ